MTAWSPVHSPYFNCYCLHCTAWELVSAFSLPLNTFGHWQFLTIHGSVHCSFSKSYIHIYTDVHVCCCALSPLHWFTKTYIVIYTCTCRFLSFAFNCAFIIQWQFDYSFTYKSVQYYTHFKKTHELKAQYLAGLTPHSYIHVHVIRGQSSLDILL